MFAAVNGNVIHVYATVTFDSILNLKGHNGKVRVHSHESKVQVLSNPHPV